MLIKFRDETKLVGMAVSVEYSGRQVRCDACWDWEATWRPVVQVWSGLVWLPDEAWGSQEMAKVVGYYQK